MASKTIGAIPAAGSGSYLASILTKYLDSMTVQSTTKQGIKDSVNAFFYYLGESGVDALEASVADFRGFFEYTNATYAPETLRKRFLCVRHFYDYLVNQQLVFMNIATQFVDSLDAYEQRVVKYNKRRAKRTIPRDKLSLDEINLLAQKARENPRIPWLPVAIDVALNSGIRRKSVCLLDLNKMSWDESLKSYVLVLTKSLEEQFDDTKIQSQRIPITKEFYERVVQYVEMRNRKFTANGNPLPPELERRVILSKQGKEIHKEAITVAFQNLLAHNLPPEQIQKRRLAFHSIRKTFATIMLNEKGFSLQEVSLMLGHAELETTQKYLCLKDDEVIAKHAKKSKEQNLDLTLDIAKEHAMMQEPELPPHERELMAQVELVKQQVGNLQSQLDIESKAQGKSAAALEVHRKQAKKTVREQMIDCAVELHNGGKGYGTIAAVIAEEFGRAFGKQSIKYWIKTRDQA